MTWLFSGRVVNPVLDAVIIDTGPLAAAPRNFQIFASATVAAPLEVQWRDAANLVTKASQVLAIPALDFKTKIPFLRELDMLANERIRIVAVTAIVGSVSVSLDIPL